MNVVCGLRIRARNFGVKELDGQWYSLDAMYFRVIADDENYYVLRHDEGQDSWTLDGFSSSAASLARVIRGTKKQIKFWLRRPKSSGPLELCYESIFSDLPSWIGGKAALAASNAWNRFRTAINPSVLYS
jgi:hypothetical protein